MLSIKDRLINLKNLLFSARMLNSSFLLSYSVLFFPFLMGSFSELARAGDSLSLPVHYALAILIFAVIWATLEFSVSIGTILMLVYLVSMGWVRRELIPTTGYISNDPITLVSTLISVLYFLRLTIHRKLPNDTPTAKILIPLIVIMIFEIANPLQGGLAVGLSGIIFHLNPILWFYIGKIRGNRKMISSLFLSIVLIAVVELIFGNRQWFSGFTEIEKFWIASGGGTQSVGKGYFRPFGTFTSFSEYVIIIVIGASLCWVSFLQKKYIYILPFLGLFATLFVSSSRGAMVTIFLVMVFIWAVQGKTYRVWFPRLALALIIAIWGASFGLEKVKEVEIDDKTQLLVNHQIKGLTDPLGKGSTGGVHVDLVVSGVLQGFKVPIGIGLGAGTLGATKFGAGGGSSEVDFSDMFISLGFIGGILYVILCIRIFVSAAQYWHDSRDTLALGALALMVACNGRWSSGGHYAQSMFFWLVIGALDKIALEYQFLKKKRIMDMRSLTNTRESSPDK
jgi:hypothetical protein